VHHRYVRQFDLVEQPALSDPRWAFDDDELVRSPLDSLDGGIDLGNLLLAPHER